MTLIIVYQVICYIKNETVIIKLFNFKNKQYTSLEAKWVVSWSGYGSTGSIVSLGTPIALSGQGAGASREDGAGGLGKLLLHHIFLMVWGNVSPGFSCQFQGVCPRCLCEWFTNPAVHQSLPESVWKPDSRAWSRHIKSDFLELWIWFWQVF